MSELSPIGRVHRRCVLWLSGQCKGGDTCTCLVRQLVTDKPNAEGGPAQDTTDSGSRDQ
jgi:hypothetical protein